MNEKEYLRELAKKYVEYANLPVMKQRTDMWYRHNDGDKNETPVIIEMASFQRDIVPELTCTDPLLKSFEYTMLCETSRHELIGDDRVIPNCLPVNMSINFKKFNIDIEREMASEFGYHTKEVILDLETDMQKLKSSVYSFDKDSHQKKLDIANEILGDIMPVVSENRSLDWTVMLSNTVVDLMGMENFFVAMLDTPELVHELFKFIRDDLEKYILWQQNEGLLISNIGNTYAGAGSYGFTNQLNKEEGNVTLKNMWGNFNSQESVGLSADMFAEFIFPYYKPLTDHFGKVYWGCCEPVDMVWDRCISTIPNLSKVSISAWCNEAFMGERLKNNDVIYSRKPSPNFVGVGEKFDEEGFRKHIKYTLDCTKDCNIEFIFRDIYSLCGEQGRAKRAVDIVRELIKNR